MLTNVISALAVLHSALASSALDQRFEKAAEYVRSITDYRPSSYQAKLEFYGLYKQATEGDVDEDHLMTVRHKLDIDKISAWMSKVGMTAEEAKASYIELVDRIEN